MGGFLDKETRIVDMILTGEGRKALSKNELNFVYWVAFDDEVDYNPTIMESGSLTAQSLSSSIIDQIENTLVREATTGYKSFNNNCLDTTNVSSALFTMPQGHTIVPKMKLISGQSGSIDIGVSQRKIQETVIKTDNDGNITETLGTYDRGVSRFDASSVVLNYGYGSEDFTQDHKTEGFLIRVFKSGSGGLVEVTERRDLQNRISFNGDLIIDDEA